MSQKSERENINLHKVIWQPIAILVIAFLLIMGVITQLSSVQKAQQLNNELKIRIESQKNSLINELFLGEIKALESRLSAIVNDVAILYPNAEMCMSLSTSPNLGINFQTMNCHPAENDGGMNSVNSLDLYIGNEVIATVTYQGIIPLHIYEMFPSSFIIAIILSVIIAIIVQIFLVKRLNGSVVTPLLKAIRQDAKAVAAAETAAQVAHDIRSPLVALDLVIKDLSSLPEQPRLIVRNSVRRIKDITNNLSTKYRDTSSIDTDKKTKSKPELCFAIVDEIISEKRIELDNDKINLSAKFNAETRGLFINVEVVEFKRVLSNLINNAADAIASTGEIQLTLTKDDDKLILAVADDGCGVAKEKITKLFEPGVSYGKTQGSGLGLAHAKKQLTSWDGEVVMQSMLGQGTTVSLSIPIVQPPKWFLCQLRLENNTTIVVLDDDESIHCVWKQRFSEYVTAGNVKLEHFYTSGDFINWYHNNPKENTLFLFDYELIGSDSTGLETINKLDIAGDSVLVTSRHEDTSIRKCCQCLGVQLLPKVFALHIPLVFDDKADFVFLDDEQALLDSWSFHAKIKGISLATFNNTKSLLAKLHKFDKSVPIYIDSELGEEKPGEVFAKVLYERGYKNLYLATGLDKRHFAAMHWIVDIVGKEAPF